MKARVAFWVDVTAALLAAALFAWCLSTARAAAEAEVRTYGYNVDSGVLLWIAAIYYFLPVALLFSIAALFLHLRWRLQWVVHWVVVALAIAPLLIPGVLYPIR